MGFICFKEEDAFSPLDIKREKSHDRTHDYEETREYLQNTYFVLIGEKRAGEC